MGDMTENFSRSEFACKCGCGLDAIYPKTVQGLQQFRDLVSARLGRDTPIVPNSGCRCPKHHEAECKRNGQPVTTKSQHLPAQGCRAVDIPKIKGMSIDTMYEIALMVPIFKQGGIITYDWGLHVDGRSGVYRGNKRRRT